MRSLFSLAASLTLATLAPSQSPDTDLAPGTRPGTARYVVQFKTRPFDLSAYQAAATAKVAPTEAQAQALIADLERQARAAQLPFTEQVERLGGIVTRQWWLVNGCAVEIEPEAVGQLRALDNVLEIHPDQRRTPGSAPAPFIKTATDAAHHNTDLVQSQGIRGQGARVAVVDTGVDSNMNGTGRPHATFFVNGDINNMTGGGLQGSRLLRNVQIGVNVADDTIGHGTSVAGVFAGERWNLGANADRGHAPDARIISYCCADDSVGGTYESTLVTAWQRLAADRLADGTKVANCSFQGYYTVEFALDQQAIENLARTGDLVIVGMGGNDGTIPAPRFAYGAYNMIAVGAVAAGPGRAVASTSTHGPMSGHPDRTYPDLVANGVNMVLPLRDNESLDRTASGTSFSSPSVAGAAALYRSVRSQADAVETKAALLATTDDIGALNQTPPDNSRNAFGVGYLRVDRLIAVANGTIGGSLIANATLPRTTARQAHPFNVVAGRYYCVALAWFRTTLTTAPSNLDLEARSSSVVLAAGRAPANTYELLRFRATATGAVSLEVVNTSMEAGLTSQAYALVAAESTPFFEFGSVASFGAGCNNTLLRVTGTAPAIGQVYFPELNVVTPNAPTLLVTSSSRTQWLGVPLPLSLTPAGATNCSLLCGFTLPLSLAANAGGAARYQLNVPLDPSLIQAPLFQQGFAVRIGVNPAGFTSSNGLEVRIGGQR